jgi:hypothetical protein
MSPRYDERPEFLRMDAWQEVDDEHPAGAGTPAYRVVFKTLRVVVASASLEWPNLVIRFAHGTVKRGGAEIRNATPARIPREWVMLEQHGLVRRGAEMEFRSLPNVYFEMGGWADEVADAWHVEFILHSNETEPGERLAEGRRRLAPVKAMLDLHFGQRLLGVLLTEELGQLHADGHWSRALTSDSVASETYLPVGTITREELLAFAHGPLDAHQQRAEHERDRIRLACDWYWTAPASGDPITEYLHLWFVVEALCMPDTSNIRPVNERLASILGGPVTAWSPVVGRHLGRRSNLVHGDEQRVVAKEHVDELRMIVEVLLAADLGVDAPPHAHALCALAGV